MHHGGWGTGDFQKTAHVAISTKWRWFNCPGERVGPRRRLRDVTGCEEHPSAPMKLQVLAQLPDRLVPWRSEPRLAEAAGGVIQDYHPASDESEVWLSFRILVSSG